MLLPLPPLQTPNSFKITIFSWPCLWDSRDSTALPGESFWNLEQNSCDGRMVFPYWAPVSVDHWGVFGTGLEVSGRFRQAGNGDAVLSSGCWQGDSNIYHGCLPQWILFPCFVKNDLCVTWLVVFHAWNTLRILSVQFLKGFERICGSSDVLEKDYLEHFN